MERLGTMFVRSVVLYLVAVVALRLMGKRQVGQLQPFELVVVIMIAELAATPMSSVGVPLLWGILPMAALIMCHGVITFLDMRFPSFAKLLSGEPTVLIRDGAICEEALRRTGVSLPDLMEAMRLAGEMDIARVGTAVLEPSGQISVFPRAESRPLTPGDIQCRVREDQLPLPLILDGEIHAENLAHAGLSEARLRALLVEMGLGSAAQVLLLSLNQGRLHAQGKGSRRVIDRAL